MLCCLLAGLLAFAGVKGRRLTGRRLTVRQTNNAPRIVGFGLCCGALAFEVVAGLAAQFGGLVTRRPELLLGAASALTLAGALIALSGGTPDSRRGWALFALGASSGSAVAELADLHLLALHRAPELTASLALHGLALVPGIIAVRFLLQPLDRARLARNS